MNQQFTTYFKPEKLAPFGSISQIIGNIQNGEEVLDIGCSQGYLASYLPNNTVYGIDYNPKSLEIAKQFCKETACVNLNSIPENCLFGGKKFDVIVFADVLEHILFPEDILNFFSQYLKPEGRIIISLPNVALWRVRFGLLFGEFNYTDYGVLDKTHLHLYTFKTAKQLACNIGLNIVKLSGAANLLGFLVKYIPLPFIRNLFSIQIIMVCQK